MIMVMMVCSETPLFALFYSLGIEICSGIPVKWNFERATIPLAFTQSRRE